MSDAIYIGDLDPAAVLAGLYNRGKPVDFGFLRDENKDMTVEDARECMRSFRESVDNCRAGLPRLLDEKFGVGFGFVGGRPIGMYLIDTDEITAKQLAEYEEINGRGSVQSVVNAIRAGKPTPRSPDNLLAELDEYIAEFPPGSEGRRKLETIRSKFMPKVGNSLEATS